MGTAARLACRNHSVSITGIAGYANPDGEFLRNNGPGACRVRALHQRTDDDACKLLGELARPGYWRVQVPGTVEMRQQDVGSPAAWLGECPKRLGDS